MKKSMMLHGTHFDSNKITKKVIKKKMKKWKG